MSKEITKEMLTGMGVEDLLALGVADVDLVEEFIPFPTGRYRWEIQGVGIEEVGQNNDKAIEVGFNISEVVELADPEEEDEVGELPREFAQRFKLENTKNGYGIRSFLTFMAPYAVASGMESATAGELMEAAPGLTGEALFRREVIKRDDGSEFAFTKLVVTDVSFD